ncbi:MAG TPA: hypothetical protein PKE29_06130 [Phycisphaerales bacterium]|nr:hypothetical protein [Phycisphaerales bacterium]
MGSLLEVDDVVTDLKLVRERGVARTELSRVSALAEAITRYFPEVEPRYQKARLRELLVLAMAELDEPHKTGIGIALGLLPDYDAKNSSYRREHFAAHYQSTSETVRRRDGLESQVFAELARKIIKILPGDSSSDGGNGGAQKPPGIVSRAGLREDLVGGEFVDNQFLVSRSPAAYRDLIGELEAAAQRIDSFPKRLSVVFKSDRAITQIATQRFGRGSAMIEPYVEEHMLRRKTFYGNLARGAVVREIYAAEDLREYLLRGHHGKGVELDRQDLAESVRLWRECMEAYPDNYLVAFTSERIPFKYEVVDSHAVVMHEAISGNDRDRLNAFAIVNAEIAGAFSRDFELVWERTPAADRSLDRTLGFIADLHDYERSG